MERALERKRDNSLRGLIFTMTEKLICYVIAFAQSVILARLLTPGDFGLVAMLMIFLNVGDTLAESGLGAALVVKCRDGKGGSRIERLSIAWNVGFAVVIYAVLAVASPTIARWFHEPVLASLLRVMALGLVMSAAGVVATARLMRMESFGRLALANSVSVALSTAVAVAMAYRGFGVWSIAGLGLVQAGAKTAFAWMLARGLPADGVSSGNRVLSFMPLLMLGFKFTVSNLIWNVYRNLWQILIGKLWSPTAVGLFTRGLRWAWLPADLVNEVVGRVSFPVLARTRNDGRQFLKFLAVNGFLLWPFLLVFHLFAEQLVEFVLGRQWLDCVPYMRILLLGAAVTPFGNVSMKMISASGRGEINLYSDAVKRPLGLVCLFFGCRFGVIGLCWAYVASEVIVSLTNLAFALYVKLTSRDIDFVFTYYGGEKPPPGVDVCRACDNGELRCAIGSVKRYAPWYRKIFVLVNDGTPKPGYVTDDIVWVEHREIVDPAVLPLYNTAAIEMWLHRLPGLAEHFIYANDDMFIGRRVSPSDFFTLGGRMICRFGAYGSLRTYFDESSVYPDMLRYGRKVVGTDDDEMPHHNMCAMTRTACAAFARDYPSEWRKSASLRYRSPEQVTVDAINEHALKIGLAVRKWCDRGGVRVRGWLHLCRYYSACVNLHEWDRLDWVLAERPKLFCVNDAENCTDEDRRRWRKILERGLWR